MIVETLLNWSALYASRLPMRVTQYYLRQYKSSTAMGPSLL